MVVVVVVVILFGNPLEESSLIGVFSVTEDSLWLWLLLGAGSFCVVVVVVIVSIFLSDLISTFLLVVDFCVDDDGVNVVVFRTAVVVNERNRCCIGSNGMKALVLHGAYGSDHNKDKTNRNISSSSSGCRTMIPLIVRRRFLLASFKHDDTDTCIDCCS